MKEKGTKMNKKEDSSPSKLSEKEILLKKLEPQYKSKYMKEISN